ncbi:MAG: VOC family protein [Acidobacteriota bacterium]
MSEQTLPAGTIAWMDLTVPDAPAVRDFYRDVVGFDVAPVAMGSYEDYCLNLAGSEQAVAGVCHARGVNANLPPVWLPYFVVADLDLSLRRCTAGGGTVLAGPRGMGKSRYAVVRDPAGACCALFQPVE